MCIESKAFVNGEEGKVGWRQYTTPWVYGSNLFLYGNAQWDGDNERWRSDSYSYKVNLSVPLSLKDVFGSDYLYFDSACNSVILVLDSYFEYGFSTMGDNGVSQEVNGKMGVHDVYLEILGKRYDVSFSSAPSSDPNTSTYKWTRASGYFPIDLPFNKQLTSWDISLNVEFDLSVSTRTLNPADYVFSPWMRWVVGNSDYTLKFLQYSYSQNVSGSDLNNQTGQITGSIDKGNQLQEENNALQKEENETSKGILGAIKDFFGGFFGNLIDSVVSLFVPSAEEMSTLLNRLNDFFSKTFGFLYYPFEVFIDFLNVFLDSDSSTGLTLPAFSIMGHEVWSEQRYDLATDALAGKVFGYVRIGTGALLAIAFVLHFRNFFDKRFGGGGS